MSLFFLLPTSKAATVTLSGETTTALDDDPSDAYARIKIDQDGNVYESADTGTPSWVQVDTAADWVRPTGAAPGSYEVRYTSLTGDALDSATAAVDTWYSLSSGDYTLVQSRATVGTDTCTFTIEIRSGATTLDSASYTLTATVNPGG